MTPIVEMQDVTRIYQQGGVEVPALRGLSLQIESGEFMALSGCPKSSATRSGYTDSAGTRG